MSSRSVRIALTALAFAAPLGLAAAAHAAGPADLLPAIPPAGTSTGASGPTSPLTMVAVLTLANLLPAAILACTCFVSFVVVLGFVRTGLSTPSAPPKSSGSQPFGMTRLFEAPRPGNTARWWASCDRVVKMTASAFLKR